MAAPVAGCLYGLAIRLTAIPFNGVVYHSRLDAPKPAPGTNGPLIPGDPERQSEQARRDKGVPLIPAVIEELRDIALKTDIPFD